MKKIARKILKKLILSGHGVSKRILIDQGSNFNSMLANEVYWLMNIVKSTTTAYHPQCDGHTERFNGTLCNMLAKLMEEHPMDWNELLPYCTFNYNISVHASTKLSPYYVLYGRKPRLPLDYMFGGLVQEAPKNLNTYVKQLKDCLNEAYTIISKNLQVAQANQKAHYMIPQDHISFTHLNQRI